MSIKGFENRYTLHIGKAQFGSISMNALEVDKRELAEYIHAINALRASETLPIGVDNAVALHNLATLLSTILGVMQRTDHQKGL